MRPSIEAPRPLGDGNTGRLGGLHHPRPPFASRGRTFVRGDFRSARRRGAARRPLDGGTPGRPPAIFYVRSTSTPAGRFAQIAVIALVAFIGLAGVGMSATAILLRDSGVAVTGSDEAIYPPISQVLAREAFVCQAPYAGQNIPDDSDLIVIGKNARLVPSENDEVAEAFARAAKPGGPKILSFAEVLALLSRGHENIVAAGSFGKTTSVAMTAHCLASVELDPSWMIGAVPLSPARASNAGTGQVIPA